MKRLAQKLVCAALMCWGVFSFLMLAGDDSAGAPMPIADFIILKVGAAISLAACFLTWRVLYKSGWLTAGGWLWK
jgi:hypothetical protein